LAVFTVFLQRGLDNRKSDSMRLVRLTGFLELRDHEKHVFCRVLKKKEKP
jgi:hypothetical protein